MTTQSPPLWLDQLINSYTKSPKYKLEDSDTQALSNIQKNQRIVDSACFTWAIGAMLLDTSINSQRFTKLKGLNAIFGVSAHVAAHLANVVLTLGVRTYFHDQNLNDSVNILAKYDPSLRILKYRTHLLMFEGI